MEEEISLRELIEALLRNKKLIAIITAVATAISVVVSLIMPPVYEARTTLLANPIGSRQNKEITNSNDVLDTISQYPEMSLETYREQFLNSEIIQATIKELDLRDGSNQPMKIRSFREKVRVEVVKDTNLIRVYVSDKDPELAAKIANTLDEKFIDFITAMTRRKGMQAVQAITDQLEAEKRALDKEAQKKRDYLMNSKDIEELNQEIITLRDQMTMYKQSLIDTDRQIQSDIRTLEGFVESGIKTSNINIEKIKAKIQFNEVKGVQANNMDNTEEGKETDSKPKALQIKNTSNVTINQEIEFDISNSSALEGAMLSAQRTQIETRLLQNVSEREVLENKIGEIQKRLADLRSTLATEEYKYNEVIRDYQLAEKAFQAYQTRRNEAEQNAAADIGRASIVVSSPAVIPDIPSGPNKKLNVAIGLVIGLMVGVFMAFFKEYWASTEITK
ncbi:MAG: hypothetical protein GX308_09790 [Epulopiscium sp.]|nr:hypothetical protein [Candidatus Epulonipiscium sp.]